jgi:hypothetical protein
MIWSNYGIMFNGENRGNSKKTQLHCHLVLHKSHMTSTGTELEALQ